MRGITSQSALTVHSESISVHPHRIKLYIMQQAHTHTANYYKRTVYIMHTPCKQHPWTVKRPSGDIIKYLL